MPRRKTRKIADPAAPASADALLFEVAWEVCQQLGGIYTVIRSKAPSQVELWGDRYCLIGPYDPQTSPVEFEESRPTGHVAEAVADLRAKGLDVRFGKWLVTGQPNTILLNGESARPYLADVKRRLWEHHDIPIPDGDELLDSVLCFGCLVEQFFLALLADTGRSEPVVAHCHEWMAGACIPELRRARAKMGIVFTTHATTLGRILAMHDEGFYEHLPRTDWLGAAKRYNIEPQARLERAAAHGAHVLTTVSEITAYECEHILDRKPEVLLPNGLNIERFVAMHEFQNLHLQYKERIHQFTRALFFPSYTFDLDQTLYFFSSGRYEYRNKGFDMTLEALARLNVLLKHAGLDRTIVFFLITRRPFRNYNSSVLHRTAMFEELRRNCDEIKEVFAEHLLDATARGNSPDYNALVDDYWRLRLRRLMHAWRASSLPSIVTHDLVDDGNDEVLSQLRYLNLVNLPNDPVKVVYHPDFVSPSSPLLGMDYDQFVRGCHLGIFPSFYEPWGYTPLECVARGLPAVTSDLSGFGTYIRKAIPDSEAAGIHVVGRRGVPFGHASQRLAEWLLDFCRMGRRERISQRNAVENEAERFSWTLLAQHYTEAHRRALETAGLLAAGTRRPRPPAEPPPPEL